MAAWSFPGMIFLHFRQGPGFQRSACVKIATMRLSAILLPERITRRWRLSFPFALAFISVVYLGWSAYQAAVSGYDGVSEVAPTGIVTKIDPAGPAYTHLQVGDIIQSVNGTPWSEAIGNSLSKRGGDTLHFEVKRGTSILSVAIKLIDPPPEHLMVSLAPLILALIFWSIGFAVEAFTQGEGVAGIFFAWCQASALMLISGANTYIGPIWSTGIYGFLLWLIGPLSVHLHMHFPQNATFSWRRFGMGLLYALAILGGSLWLVLGPQKVRSSSWFPLMISTSRFFLAVNLLIVVGLLFYAYRHATTVGARGKIRIVVLGGALSALPVVTLTILPDALLHQTVVPYSFAFVLLGILPLTYGYAIFRHRLIEVEKHVNRGATFILVYSILGAFYLVLYAILQRWLPNTAIGTSLVNTFLVLLLASAFVPLQRRVQRVVDTAFYGGWYDYRTAVTNITQGIEQITELKSLAETIANRLISTLHLEESCVFLRDADGVFSTIEVAPHRALTSEHPLSFSTLPRSSLNYLLRIGEVERSSLRQALSEVSFTPEEHQLLESEQVYLWVPVIGHGQVQGLMALGPKFGGDIFSGEDMDILRVVARQIGPIIENIHLLTRLRQYAAELEQRVRERTAELYDAKERVEAILASVGDGVVVSDLNGRIVTVNAAFEEQSGFDADELIGHTLYDLFKEKSNTETLDNMRVYLAKGWVWTGDLNAKTKDGRSYDIQLTMAPVRDQVGRIVSSVGSLRDITRQKELDRLKDQFVSDVSHELRTPTTNISLFLELLEDAPVEKRAQYLGIVREQSLLVRKLVEDILDLSRLTMGKKKSIEFSAVDLNKLTEEVVNAHQPMALAAGDNLIYTPGTDIPSVFGERNQLARLITNLLTNAVRYTPHGEVCVSTYSKNDRVFLAVEDTGIGIDPEDRPHLFERFYRGRQVRQSKIHGTGLGLAIVKEIVDLHEGEIEIISELGRGSIFNVSLPAVKT
jgi:two-component system NtrC family sensor kinase